MYYDSSVACDSFQLGEMIRFFSRIGLFTFISPIMVNEDAIPPTYEGDIQTLMADLKSVPSWQYDQHHAHCGLRTPLIPRLEFIQTMLNQGVGIDWSKWKRDPLSESWASSPGDEKKNWIWAEKKNLVSDKRLSLQNFLAIGVGRDFWTARSWDWNGEY